jgi:multisubunit Na+/H+ antiporter MnhB subunit
MDQRIKLATGIACICIFSAFFIFTTFSPDFNQWSQKGITKFFIDEGWRKLSATNTVCTIVWEYRGYDTLGEETVLFTAAMGVFAMGFGTAANVMLPVILLFGIYVIAHGHTTPGGTFSGGSVMAGAFVIFTLAYGIKRTEKDLKESMMNALKSVAGFILIMLILFAFFIREALVPTERIFSLWSGSSLMFFNIVGGVMVFTGLLLIWYTVVKTDMD